MANGQSGQDLSFGQRLRLERESHHWSQKQLSKEIIGDESLLPSIHRWEKDIVHPRPYYVAKLCEAFGKPVELWGVKEQKSRFWHVPYLRNQYFTGREQFLQRLHKALAADNALDSSQIRAISGLGGIGKTQTAIEYAYRYAGEYVAVLWVQADSHETLSSNFANLAIALNLHDKEEIDQPQAIASVKRWLLDHDRWLLIFDNADDLEVVSDYFPRWPAGSILVTTRSQETGLHIKPIELERMNQKEGVIFLLRRTSSGGDEDGEEDLSKMVPDIELQAAQQLWQMMGGLPLALDQAGAYIKETQCSFAEYMNLYHEHREDLLRKRGGLIPEHPEAVTTTWDLSFQRVEQKNLAAAELLQFCAFLSPDAIPEDLISRGAAFSSSPFQALAASARLRNDAFSTLRTYSLVRRDPTTRTLSIHRLVQAVLRDAMSIEERQQWKGCVVRVLNEAFPEAPFQEWAKCGRLLPHVLVCANGIEDEPMPTQLEASSVLDRAGSYLREQGQYAEAELLLKQALALREQHLGGEHLDTATSLSNLAGLYSYQGKYKQAESLVERTLAIRKQHLGAEHPEIAKSLNHLAVLHMWQGQYEQAEPLFQQALSLSEQSLGVEHPDTVKYRGNLAVLYLEQEKYESAEPLFQQALSLNKQSLGPDHPDTARVMGNLGLIYLKQGRYEQADPLFQQALSIHLQSSGAESPDTAYPLYGLAELCRVQGRYEQAEPLFQQALSIRRQHLEAEHLDTAEALEGLGNLYQDCGRYAEAEPLYVQALAIREKILGREHPSTQIIRQHYLTIQQAIEQEVEEQKREGEY